MAGIISNSVVQNSDEHKYGHGSWHNGYPMVCSVCLRDAGGSMAPKPAQSGLCLDERPVHTSTRV